MNLQEALDFIHSREGKIFSVRFKKRSTGEIREMSCRQGVTKGLVEEPSSPPTNWNAHKLINVWSMKDEGYRAIPIEGILAVKVDGEWVEIERSVK